MPAPAQPTLDRGLGRKIVAYAEKRGTLRNALAYMLATAWHETAATMQPVVETFYLSQPERDRYNKAKYYWPWIGRGLVQLTHRENYVRAGAKIGVDLTSDPDKALDPDVSVAVLVLGMEQGWFTGKKIADYITLQRSDFVGARRIVNGRDRANHIAGIAKRFDALLLAEGYGVDAPAPPAEEVPPQGWVAVLAALVAAIRGMLKK